MKNVFNIKPGDIVKLTVGYEIIEPAINDGEKIMLEQGWQRKFIEFVDNGANAKLLYMNNQYITFNIPTDIIVPVEIF